MSYTGKSNGLTSEIPEYPQTFRVAVEKALADEGGLVENPADPGGITKFGISQRQYPDLLIAQLTREQAIAIYYRDWWKRFGYEQLPRLIAEKVFDLAINIGPGEATRCLQRALRACGIDELEDGILGQETRAQVQRADNTALLAALRSEAAGHYRLIAASRQDKGSAPFLKGWLRRAYE